MAVLRADREKRRHVNRKKKSIYVLAKKIKKLQEIKLKEDKAVKRISDLPAEEIAKALHTALAKSKEKEKDN